MSNRGTEVSLVDRRIPLSRSNAGVPECLSNEVKVVRLLVETGREGVAEGVNRELVVERRPAPPVGEPHLNLPCTDPGPAAGAKEGA